MQRGWLEKNSAGGFGVDLAERGNYFPLMIERKALPFGGRRLEEGDDRGLTT